MLRRYVHLRHLIAGPFLSSPSPIVYLQRWCSGSVDSGLDPSRRQNKQSTSKFETSPSGNPNKSTMAYSDTGKEGPIALPPTKRLAIVTCMDARINPFSQLGIDLGEAHIIRNAGGVARDALRSLIISQRLLGTREIAVYHHTGCGLVTMTTPGLQKLVKDAEPTNAEAGKQIDGIDFLEYGPDLEKSVRDDVQFLQDSPLILKGTKITGWIWDVETEKASQVV
ncbi:carbonic anhydrase [Pleurotus eryngii]|uniref:Carbonic anhydrase n=1 Tax=Pleurotus eryngii TaxID=5323 RepID=A0A9P6DHZ3_PLEER|nr:carbonic anhydrase [Pleurotus eryngii]